MPESQTLGVEVKDLYDIEVPFSVEDDVQAKTLGEIKDLVSDRDTFEVDRLAWEEQRTTRENELMQSNQELTDIVSMLPRSAISPELVAAVTLGPGRQLTCGHGLFPSLTSVWVRYG